MGGDGICRRQKHRRFRGPPLRAYRRQPDWAETGWWTGGLNVLVVRDGAPYEATNRLTMPATEVRRVYRVRAQLAEVRRVCTDHLGLSGCPARSERAQGHHLTCGVVAVCVLERDRSARGLSIDTLKRCLSVQGRSMALPALQHLRSAA
jgi:hypothetical protein